MDIRALPIKITKDEAIDIAKSGNNSLLSRLILKNKEVHEVRLHYIEFKVVTLKIHQNKSIFMKKKQAGNTNELNILVNGSTGAGSIVQELPVSEIVKNVDNDIIQYSDKDERRVKSKANKMAIRLSHRFMGGIPEIEIVKIKSIFRPYWVVFFGKVELNTRVSYLPIEADGFVIGM
ncbi:hypothetical protein IC214_03440 [Clostridioides sp. ES-S-0190-01]|nr:hypothetical protein [Clostridioides sp. ES-S-0049-03]MCC0653821.1 hypothetical protein [Clostridioides sp. ES-S-0001-03]MCC0677481.1 hypothetical protein [Clostridioides sp. ES-W-0018-02]MCC0704343.1 hypothetical protein [Clostridioides sp. ES-S-0049-02]MCC0706082.1 hypothetical protein [Clostridioides sp. ES-S-0190-01]MCC0712279.1 hypothetical protein [Clostridioides sp. ES-W-0017-02]UDN58609.1 hypothetical protein JJC01_01700 [Clostridioides sp. ES-S-0010-02]